MRGGEQIESFFFNIIDLKKKKKKKEEIFLLIHDFHAYMRGIYFNSI
jgi:hypothetical protein